MPNSIYTHFLRSIINFVNDPIITDANPPVTI